MFRSPNHLLIGQPGSRSRLQTPALVLELDVLERNLLAMADFLRERGPKLRPHTKTHKSVRIAKMQIAAGAIGVSCTTLGEAEVLVDGVVDRVLITSPVVAAAKMERLVTLHGTADDLMVVVDNLKNVDALAGAAQAAGKPLRVLIDVDLGRHRTGVAGPQDAETLAGRLKETKDLEYCGVQAYDGRLQHIHDYDQRARAWSDVTAKLRDVIDRLRTAGLPPAIVTGGGTGTFPLDVAGDLFTDLQAGSYLFMDVDYHLVRQPDRDAPRFETALFVAASVISANHSGLATIDAGVKSFATDCGLPQIAAGAPAGSTYEFSGDEHGLVHFPDKTHRAELGDVVWCVTPHCDPTVNLYDHYHCVRGDELVDIWPIDARGRSL